MTKVRKAQNKDLKKVAKIFKTEYSKPPYNEKWSEKAIIKKVKEYFKNNYFFVLEIEKGVAGFLIGHSYLWHDGIRGLIDEFVVDSKFQGKGHGSQLINHFEIFLKKKGIKKLSLFSVTKSRAFNVYQRLGFKKEDFVSMIKNLK